MNALAASTNDQALVAARSAARAALTGGVTTIRDLRDRDYLTIGLPGEPGLPSILTTGPPITTPAGHCHFLSGASEVTVTGIRTAVQQHAEPGR